jgi:hypothetical protein
MQNSLPKPLRTQLENTVKAARDVAEKAALAALHQLGVGDAKLPEHLDDAKKSLRRRLRAHGRSLGDAKHKDESQDLTHLKWEVAYEHWHRMLFARFLSENHLLLWEPGAPVTLAECEELAQDPSTNLGAKTGWELAGRLAARMLPQVFKTNSPVFELRLSPNEQRDLENLLKALPTETFQASDSLGWVYQFWQAKRKDEVNASEVKIGADELPAVTQLFTEPYMVEFLLHNSLGAWWHTRHPGKPCPVELTYLRTLDDGTPAAGKFRGWPDTLATLKLLDPCCGSGHFLVAAFLLLAPMRMAAEGLSARDAVDAVLRDNLHGLEIDPRCVEIAVFALALAAWRFPDESGHPLGVRSDMPAPNIACCGLKVFGKPQDWEALVPDSAVNAQLLRQELRLLHASFAQAPLLGSLLDPAKSLKNDLATSSFDSLKGLLDLALAVPPAPTLLGEDEGRWENALAAQGLMEAARLLDVRYHLVITNVPYLVLGRQSLELRNFALANCSDAKNDLATIFLHRCLELVIPYVGSVAAVSPQNWLYQSRYKNFRKGILANQAIKIIARLGPGAFETISGEVVQVSLSLISNKNANDKSEIQLIDVSTEKSSAQKANKLKTELFERISHELLLQTADARIFAAIESELKTLSNYATTLHGQNAGDNSVFNRFFWEVSAFGEIWKYYQVAPASQDDFVGRSQIVMWENEDGRMARLAESVRHLNHKAQQWRSGKPAWGKKGIAVSLIGRTIGTFYSGDIYGVSCAVIIPIEKEHLGSLWEFIRSGELETQLRIVDPSLAVQAKTLLAVPFDPIYWGEQFNLCYPNGLPKPYSDDTTQWIFHGHPQTSTDPLQVAIARLLGYTWPAESDANMELSDEACTWIGRCKSLAAHTDDDGIVCLPAVRGEKPAHERLLSLLIDAWETVQPGSWKSSFLDKLLADADCVGKGLEVWLREKFFEQHAKRFSHRPFIWHIWDGLKDGFGALVNYHQLDNKNLERLIHTYLGDWIRHQEQGVKDGVDGAQARLAAAQILKIKLEAILEGDTPHDIFVRWKPLAQQPIGWNPDLNDGVRLNIRPFMQAEVLRHNKKPKLNITWDKDRGKDVESAPWFKVFKGERINDHHLTLDEKRRSRG